MLWELNKTRIALVEEVSNKLGLPSALDFLTPGILYVHITLLICLGQSPIEYVVPIGLDDFFDSIYVSVSSIRLEVSLSAGVLPNRNRDVVNPFLLEPETHCGYKRRSVGLVLALVVEQRVRVLQVSLDLASVSRACHPPLKTAKFWQLNANLKLVALLRPR